MKSVRPPGSPPRLVGPYRVGAPIGKGAAANVFEAVHVETGERVALKIMHADWAARVDVVARFVREGRALQNLNHPNVVRVFDHGTGEDGTPWIAMEHLSAVPLESFLHEKRRPDMRRAVKLATDIARALGAVHEAGIVHRDVKPENVLVADPATAMEAAKLIDFGIAKVTAAEMGENSVAHTRVGSVLGSTAYASPEQLNGEPVDARTDVFALAVTLYEVLSGQLPFEGNTVKDQLHARRIGAVVPISQRGVIVPPELEELLSACLAVDRERRPRDGRAMAEALSAITASAPPPPITTKPPGAGSAALDAHGADARGAGARGSADARGAGAHGAGAGGSDERGSADARARGSVAREGTSQGAASSSEVLRRPRLLLAGAVVMVLAVVAAVVAMFLRRG